MDTQGVETGTGMPCPYKKDWKQVGQEVPAQEACLRILVKAIES